MRQPSASTGTSAAAWSRREIPDSGAIDLPTLDLLGRYRREAATSEPLALGIYGEVLECGSVRVGGDAVVVS